MMTRDQIAIATAFVTKEQIAIATTVCAANLKDWRITNNKTRRGREAAKALLEGGRGYFVGTKAEAAARWPEFISLTGYESEPEARFIWAFDTVVTGRDGRRRDIALVPIAEA